VSQEFILCCFHEDHDPLTGLLLAERLCTFFLLPFAGELDALEDSDGIPPRLVGISWPLDAGKGESNGSAPIRVRVRLALPLVAAAAEVIPAPPSLSGDVIRVIRGRILNCPVVCAKRRPLLGAL
jgi:hypothetical protein